MSLFSYCYFLFPGIPHFWPLFCFRVASFPGHSRPKLLIAYSIAKNGGGRPGRKSHVHDIRYM